MKKIYPIVAFVAVTCLVIGTSKMLSSAPQELPQKVQTWPPHLPFPVDTKGVDRPFAYPRKPPGHVGNRVRYEKDVEARLAGAEAALTALEAPPERLAYYRDVLSDPAYQLDGWYLSIQKVEGAERVTVNAIPIVSAPTIAARVLVMGACEETYELKSGALKLVKTRAVGDSPAISIMGF